MEYLRIYESASGGSVDLHPLHGKDELPDNAEACRVLADHGYRIELLPAVVAADFKLREKLLPDAHANKNPDVRINGIWIGDIKTPDKESYIKKSTINNFIYSAARQKVKVVIINLFAREYAVRDIKKGIIGALQPERNKSIRQVWVITKDRNLFLLNREIVFNDAIYEVLGSL